jgi:DNA-directed RNA polymerase subunit RPC12/RpoP
MSKRTLIRHCPICRHAMVSSKSRENLDRPDIYRCLNCGTEIVETPRESGSDKSPGGKAS